MDKFLNTISIQFVNIRYLFAGFSLESNSKEIIEFSKELSDLNIPTYSQDRENLRRDRNNISKDLTKVLSEKQLELETY